MGEDDLSELSNPDPYDTPPFNLMFYVLVLLYVAYLGVQSLGYVWRAARLPLFVIAFAAVLCVIGIAVSLDRMRREGPGVASYLSTSRLQELGNGRSYSTDDRLVRLSFYVLLLAVYGLLASTVGLFTGTFLVTFLHVMFNTRNPARSTIFAAALVIALYVIFVVLLGNTLLLHEDVVAGALAQRGII